MGLTPADVHSKKQEITAPGGIFEMEDVTWMATATGPTSTRPKRWWRCCRALVPTVISSLWCTRAERYSYSDFFEQVDALAASLQVDFGVERVTALPSPCATTPSG